MKKLILILAALNAVTAAMACTSLIAGKKATADGSVIVTYNADAYVLYGELYHTEAADHKKGEMLKVYEWDTNEYRGEIEQVEHTYATVGNINEHQLCIVESTWDNRKELQDTTAIIDYGSLIYITLQRARTAREAIGVMTSLVEKYGYYSGGESFTIADPNEVWIMEMVSKGMKEKGAVWVAIRIPDDCIAAHANQSRIHHIPFDDKDNCLYSPDVVSFARKMGYFEGKDNDFSFSKAYAQSDYLSYRGCDGRVWAYYNRFSSGMDKYLPFVIEAQGETLPLYVKPDKQLSVRDIQNMMRDHYDNTPMDMRKEPGRGSWDSPVRYAPLTWKVDSVEYMHERPIATQQTGFTLVAQLRSWLPDAIGGVLWFGVDDSSLSVYNPIYCCLDKVPECFRKGNGDMLHFSWTSAFWINNWVANQVYARYSLLYPDVKRVQTEIEDGYEANQPLIEAQALRLYEDNPAKAVRLLSDYSNLSAEHATARYKKLGEYLLMKYMDGRMKNEDNGQFAKTPAGYPASPASPGYNEEYYRKVVEADTTQHLRIREVK
ncbi:MAG: C69 family dipeptidase [Muribaculaceae bacterium]|nr:C69 family dipeptidase [Muribaculaceae bacterium]